MSGLTIEHRPSPNFDNRACAVSHIILHYTDMADCEAALARLCDAAAKVSAHYLIRRDGHIFQLVDERRALGMPVFLFGRARQI